MLRPPVGTSVYPLSYLADHAWARSHTHYQEGHLLRLSELGRTAHRSMWLYKTTNYQRTHFKSEKSKLEMQWRHLYWTHIKCPVPNTTYRPLPSRRIFAVRIISSYSCHLPFPKHLFIPELVCQNPSGEKASLVTNSWRQQRKGKGQRKERKEGQKEEVMSSSAATSSNFEMVSAPACQGEAHPCPPGEAHGEAKMQAGTPSHRTLTPVFHYPLGGCTPSKMSLQPYPLIATVP